MKIINNIEADLNVMPMDKDCVDSRHSSYSNNLWEAHVWPSIEKIITSDKVNTMLDAGSGNGRRSKFFSNYVNQVVAVDVADLQNLSYDKNHAYGIDNVEYVSTNFMDLPEDKKYDVIYSEGFFYYLYQCYEEKAFKKILSLLREGGIFIIIEGHWRTVNRSPKYNLEQLMSKYNCKIIHEAPTVWGSGDNRLSIVQKNHK
tara:strand:- start:278 stop:880 length:603 start_codon:yes stop_codon:yes gene_type:complete